MSLPSPSQLPEQQLPILGLEDYVCTFQCLTHCPLPDGSCIWDDPDLCKEAEVDLVKYPEFFWWRFNNLPDSQKPAILTPDSMCEFYKKPEGDVYCCPRCLSTNIRFGEVYIVCDNCNYNEPLVDSPENVGRCA